MNNPRITYRNTVVTVGGQVRPDATASVGYRATPGATDGILPVAGVVTLSHGQPGAFEALLTQAHHTLSHFRQSQAGSEWGADGVGYIAQKNSGNLCIHKSGVGPRKYKEGLAATQQCERCRAFLKACEKETP